MPGCYGSEQPHPALQLQGSTVAVYTSQVNEEIAQFSDELGTKLGP